MSHPALLITILCIILQLHLALGYRPYYHRPYYGYPPPPDGGYNPYDRPPYPPSGGRPPYPPPQGGQGGRPPSPPSPEPPPSGSAATPAPAAGQATKPGKKKHDVNLVFSPGLFGLPTLRGFGVNGHIWAPGIQGRYTDRVGVVRLGW